MKSRRRPGYFLALFVLVYVTADFADPLTPGVFFFEKDVLFVDGVVQLKSDASTPLMPLPPMVPSERPAGADDENTAVNMSTAARRVRPAPLLWKNQKHDDSASSASASPPDSSPSPFLS